MISNLLLKVEVSNIIMLAVLLFLIALMVFGYFRRSKYAKNLSNMRAELKTGDKVMTDTGIVGEIVDKRVDGEYNFVTIKTGSGDHVGYMEIYENSIYYVFGKDGEPDYAGQKLAEEQTETASNDTKSEKQEETKATKENEK